MKNKIVPWLTPSKFCLVPMRLAIPSRRSFALRSCSRFSSSAAFWRNSVYKQIFVFSFADLKIVICQKWLTLSFFLRSGVMKPFLPFLARAASSRRARTSAFLRSFSSALRFSSCETN